MWNLVWSQRFAAKLLFSIPFAFPDDIVILTNNDRDFQVDINTLREELRVINMEINPWKTIYMRKEASQSYEGTDWWTASAWSRLNDLNT